MVKTSLCRVYEASGTLPPAAERRFAALRTDHSSLRRSATASRLWPAFWSACRVPDGPFQLGGAFFAPAIAASWLHPDGWALQGLCIRVARENVIAVGLFRRRYPAALMSLASLPKLVRVLPCKMHARSERQIKSHTGVRCATHHLFQVLHLSGSRSIACCTGRLWQLKVSKLRARQRALAQ